MGFVARFIGWLWRRFADYQSASVLLDMLDIKTLLAGVVGGVGMLIFGATNDAWSAPGVILAALIAGACVALITVGLRFFFAQKNSSARDLTGQAISDEIPLHTAASEAYGATRGTIVSEMAERGTDQKHGINVLTWYATYMAVTFNAPNLWWVQSVNATRLVVYRRVFQSPRSFVGVD